MEAVAVADGTPTRLGGQKAVRTSAALFAESPAWRGLAQCSVDSPCYHHACWGLCRLPRRVANHGRPARLAWVPGPGAPVSVQACGRCMFRLWPRPANLYHLWFMRGVAVIRSLLVGAWQPRHLSGARSTPTLAALATLIMVRCGLLPVILLAAVLESWEGSEGCCFLARPSDWGSSHLTGRKLQWCLVVLMLALWRWTIAGKTTLTSAITKVLSESGGATFIDYGNIDKVR